MSSREEYNQCIKGKFSELKEADVQQKVKFCASAKICSGKAENISDAIMVCTTDLQSYIEEIEKKGIKVRLTESEELLDYAGLNSLACKSLGCKMPFNEIWIDKSLPVKKQIQTLQHELKEMTLIKSGASYWDAHRKALEEE